MKINVESVGGAGMVQYGDIGAPWLSLTPNAPRAALGGEATRGMSGRGISAAENRGINAQKKSYVARFTGPQGTRWPGAESDDELLAIAKGFFPNENIVGVQR